MRPTASCRSRPFLARHKLIAKETGASRGDASLATTTTTTTTTRQQMTRRAMGHALAGLVLVGTVRGPLDASALPGASSVPSPSVPSVPSGTDLLSSLTGLAKEDDIKKLRDDMNLDFIGVIVFQFFFFSQLRGDISGLAKSTEVLKVGDVVDLITLKGDTQKLDERITTMLNEKVVEHLATTKHDEQVKELGAPGESRSFWEILSREVRAYLRSAVGK
jgi:hypothetical protein